jgi:hypothetical protein
MKAKQTIALVCALVLTLGVSSMAQQSWTFGSADDGLAGFVPNVAGDTNSFFSLKSGSVYYTNGSPGTVNSSLLRTIGIDRTPGTTTSFQGTFTFTGGYADDNNRIGMYLFSNGTTILNEDDNGLSLVWNYDAPTGNNSPDDEIYFANGIDNGVLSLTENRDITDYNVPTELIGTEITLGVDVTFNLDGTISLLGSLTDDQGNVTTVTNTSTLLAADYLGDNFGFTTRARARNILIGGSRSEAQEIDYETFSVIPEPGTLSLFALLGGGILFIRRRFGK